MWRVSAAAFVEALKVPVTTAPGPQRPVDFAGSYRTELPASVTLARALCGPAAAAPGAGRALRDLYELSIAQIAVTLEISEGAVEVHLDRARAALAAAPHLEVGR